MSNELQTEFSAAEVLGLYSQLHQQMSRLAYRVSRWIEPGSGLDWARADRDSRDEMESTRGELFAAGYLDADGSLTERCGDYGAA